MTKAIQNHILVACSRDPLKARAGPKKERRREIGHDAGRSDIVAAKVSQNGVSI